MIIFLLIFVCFFFFFSGAVSRIIVSQRAYTGLDPGLRNNYFSIIFHCPEFTICWQHHWNDPSFLLSAAFFFFSFNSYFSFVSQNGGIWLIFEVDLNIFSFLHILEKELATHFSILAWETHWAKEPWQATVHGVTKSWAWLSDWNMSCNLKRHLFYFFKSY